MHFAYLCLELVIADTENGLTNKPKCTVHSGCNDLSGTRHDL